MLASVLPLPSPWKDFYVDTRKESIDVDAAWEYLSNNAYWGLHRTKTDFKRQIEQATLVFGLFVQRGETDPSMVGLARASGDGDTFYLDDVYVAQSHQGCGLGVAFLQLVLEGQDRNAYRWLLHTGDRKDWYIDKLGFTFVGKASAMTADKTPLYILEKDGLHLKSTGDRRG